MKNKLTKKLGPLPVWAWALVIVGGYLVAKKLRGGSLLGGSAAQDNSAASPAVDPGAGAGDSGTGIGAGAGGGGFVQPVQVTGGHDTPAQQADYTGLLTTAIDSLGGAQGVLGASLDNAVSGLTDTNTALVDSVTQTSGALIDKARTPISVTVKVPTDKSGKRTAAPHHKVDVVTPPKGQRKSAAAPPSHKATMGPAPHPATVRPVVQHVAHAQGSKPAGHSPALHGGGGGGRMLVE